MKFTEEADYEVKFSYKDMAGNTNKAIQTGDSAAPLKFTLDKTIPTASIQVGTWTQSVKGYLWDHFVEDKSFGLWTNSAVKVTVSNKDELSGIDVIEHFRSPEILSLEEVKAWTNWINVDETKRTFDFTVNPDEQFIVYVHIVDKAGNVVLASIGQGTTISDRYTQQLALEAARKAKFTEGDQEQIGSITYNFKLN
jgi:hypothetical protein